MADQQEQAHSASDLQISPDFSEKRSVSMKLVWVLDERYEANTGKVLTLVAELCIASQTMSGDKLFLPFNDS
ncbi:hypothetical protein [uncultured Ruegeria sp.]|uniref:hypothetical protein n=1 Tax=uncultured Ruegeria sp. TaxID=259304 RepID=UPI002605CF99|nr:hypothetical protein [uncultured Ruegeria sp.]